MFSATSLLLLACACAVTINAQDNDKCAYAHEGTVSNNPAPYKPLQFAAPKQLVTFPDRCDNGQIGLYVVACGSDVAPLINLKGNRLTVTRQGDGVVTVNATAYCAVRS